MSNFLEQSASVLCQELPARMSGGAAHYPVCRFVRDHIYVLGIKQIIYYLLHCIVHVAGCTYTARVG